MNQAKENWVDEAIRRLEVLPDTARTRAPVVRAVFAVSATTLWRRMREGKIPRGRKDGGVLTWSVGEIRRALAEQSK